ncbi:MAG: sodium:solute symporter, partial [Planctomycetes bacterium]|nr:sodium:solute symporter [Planctomycetota bacterium]
MRKVFFSALILVFFNLNAFAEPSGIQNSLEWSQLPDLPDPLGVAGPFAGVHNDALIIAGGANFPLPVWETSKVWHDKIYVLLKPENSTTDSYQWVKGFRLDKPLAYGMSVSTEHGVVCIGGNDGKETFSDVFLLTWDPEKKTISQKPFPSLPEPCAYGAAAQIADTIYLAGGCSGLGLETATTNFWSMDLSEIDDPNSFEWEPVLTWPGPSRAFNLTVAQHNGKADCIYVFSGRRRQTDTNGQSQVQFLTDIYEFNPANYQPKKYDPATRQYAGKKNPWRKRADLPRSVMAGAAIKVGQSHIFVLGGADGQLFDKADELKDNHPGFPRNALAYHTITDTWINAGDIPANHVTTTALRWGTDSVRDPIIVPTGEIRPRVRSPKIWRVIPVKGKDRFGWIDFSTIGIYLTLLILVGVFFSFRNKNSDDFFRGGRRVPWIVAGLSIFATMLSSITFIAIPAKTYATDWLYFLVNMAAIAVTPLVILLFLPFFRKIDAASAYEYLEKRFSRPVRLFASASFILFQIGRMAIVLYLPALALAAITPFTELQCILLMGVLSIVYCTMGGLEAVVWTDAIQTFVLLGGALLSLVLIIFSVQGGFS